MNNTDESPPLALRWNHVACEVIYYAQLPPTLAARTLANVLHMVRLTSLGPTTRLADSGTKISAQ